LAAGLDGIVSGPCVDDSGTASACAVGSGRGVRPRSGIGGLSDARRARFAAGAACELLPPGAAVATGSGRETFCTAGARARGRTSARRGRRGAKGVAAVVAVTVTARAWRPARTGPAGADDDPSIRSTAGAGADSTLSATGAGVDGTTGSGSAPGTAGGSAGPGAVASTTRTGSCTGAGAGTGGAAGTGNSPRGST
jgi:hypothetical protein